jgi:hypothetical protein
MSFTLLGAKIGCSVRGPMGIKMFWISGNMTHKISSVELPDPLNPGFAPILVVGDYGMGEGRRQDFESVNQALGQPIIPLPDNYEHWDYGKTNEVAS